MVWPPHPSKTKVRSNQAQLRLLVEYMMQHRRFARGDFRGPVEIKKLVQQWEDLRDMLNKYGPVKSIEQWRHTWRDLKKKARDDALRIHSNRSSTDKPTFSPNVSEMNSKILSIIENDWPSDLRSEAAGNLSQTRSSVSQRKVGTPPVRSQVTCDNGFIVIDPQEESGDYNRLHEEEEMEDQNDEGDSVQAHEAEVEANQTKIDTYYKIAVIPEGFPNEQFESDGWAAFVSIMFEKLEATTKLPGVNVEGIVAGAIHISCKRNTDVMWVRRHFHRQIIDGRSVKVVSTKDLPKPVKMSWQTRNHVITSSSRVIKLMQRAHPSLRTAEWQVTETILEEGLIKRIVLMDRISADYIKSWGCKLNNGMCTDDFEVLEDSDVRAGISTEHNEDSLTENESNAHQTSPKRETQTPSPIVEVQEVWLTPQENDAVTENLDQDVDTRSQCDVLTD